MKRVLTYTIIAGNKACPNDCPICISKMTPDFGIGYDADVPDVDWGKFKKATRIALNHGAQNVLITGKGEPTLYPFQISRYLLELYGEPFDKRELQTEGSLLASGGFYDGLLEQWGHLGLDTVAVSIYHYDSQKNREIFRPRSGKYYILPKLIEKIHSKNLNTRLSCVMLDGYIDCAEEVKNLIDFAKQYDVFQLTLRRADRPETPLDRVAADFVDRHRLSDERVAEIRTYLEDNGTVCDKLPHGAIVYEVDEQNVCLTTGLTKDAGEEEIRQLIFFPQGWLTTSWENVKGGRIL